MRLSPLVLALGTAYGVAHADSELPALDIVASPLVEAINLDDYAMVSAVVGEDQLRDENALDLASALRRTPGVQISRFNPVGAFGGAEGGGVAIRGMGQSRPGSEIKTYIDGVPFYMGVWNHPLLDLLPINGMQSITVYKSPQLTVNGNNFASVDLTTRRATQDGVAADARVTGGQFRTFTEQANLTGKSGAVDYMLAQGYATSDGHRPNADGELKNAMGRLGFAFDEHWSAELGALAVDSFAHDPGDNRLPAPPANQMPSYDTNARLFSAALKHRHGDWLGELRFYDSRGDGNLFDPNGFNGGTANTHFATRGLRWKESAKPWQGGTLSGGVDVDQIDGHAVFPPAFRVDLPQNRVTSPWLGLAQNVTLNTDWALQASAALRHYSHNRMASETAPQAGLALVSERVTWFVNASRGINYPGLEVPLLNFLIGGTPVNAPLDLEAERDDHAEVGMKLQLTARTGVDVSVFQDKIANRYVFSFFPVVQFVNLGDYRNRGAEVSVHHRFSDDWSMFAGYTWLDSSQPQLPYAPQNALAVGVNGRVAGFDVALDAQAQSAMWALNQGRVGPTAFERVDGFTVVNARVGYPVKALGSKGEVFVSVENLFDADYAYHAGYPMPGRWAQLGLSLGFD